jgi:hypothetical protein
LIVVGVALDTVQQIESHLITRNYEGFAGPKGHGYAVESPRARAEAAACGSTSSPKDEIRLMREAGLVRGRILDDICAAAKPGVSTWELNRVAAQGIDKHR